MLVTLLALLVTYILRQFAGPSTYVARGDTLKIRSAGAIQDVKNSGDSVWFVGSVNGGVWRTDKLEKEIPGN